jgi:hypothetical protein
LPQQSGRIDDRIDGSVKCFGRGQVGRGLLFPASPVFSRHKQVLYVTNLALDIRLFGLTQSVDSQWTAKVKRYSISKLKARIPRSGDDD